MYAQARVSERAQRMMMTQFFIALLKMNSRQATHNSKEEAEISCWAAPHRCLPRKICGESSPEQILLRNGRERMEIWSIVGGDRGVASLHVVGTGEHSQRATAPMKVAYTPQIANLWTKQSIRGWPLNFGGGWVGVTNMINRPLTRSYLPPCTGKKQFVLDSEDGSFKARF